MAKAKTKVSDNSTVNENNDNFIDSLNLLCEKYKAKVVHVCSVSGEQTEGTLIEAEQISQEEINDQDSEFVKEYKNLCNKFVKIALIQYTDLRSAELRKGNVYFKFE